MSTIIVCGRLGKDAELRTTTSGTKVAAFSVADKIGYGDKKRTQWIKCSLFGERAEKVAPYLTKGSLVEVIGTPQTEAWIKDNKANSTIAVSVSDVRLHGGGQAEGPKTYDASATSRDDPYDSEIPF